MPQFVGFYTLMAINQSFFDRFSKILCLNLSSDSEEVEQLNFVLIICYTNITSSLKWWKVPLFRSKLRHFSVHKFEKLKFIDRIHMEYFHLRIFVIPRVYLIRKYGSQRQAFFSYFIVFSTPWQKYFVM